MAYTVQDDNGLVADANAYFTVAEFKTYCLDRGYATVFDDDDITIAGTVYTNASIEKSGVRGTDYLDQRFRYNGTRLQREEQTTQFPRSGCYNADGDYMNGVVRPVKRAAMEYALFDLTGTELNPNPSQDESGRVVESLFERVGPIATSKKFASNAAFAMPIYPRADRILTMEGLVQKTNSTRRG